MSTERRVCEFFSGIGGLHYALRRTGERHRVVCAYDVDEAANATYHRNLGGQATAANLCSLTAEKLRAHRADTWLLSPPCQPYSRQGQQLGEADGRANALTHITNLLGSDELLPEELLPSFLLLENVVGFESSSMRAALHAALIARGFAVREFWLSPVHIGVPNQRTRYFMLAKRGSAFAPAPPALEERMLSPEALAASLAAAEPLPAPRGEVSVELQARCAPLSSFLMAPADAAAVPGLRVGEHLLERYGAAMDVVGRGARRSTCFTKNYSRYVKGTGSVIAERLDAPALVRPAAPSRPLRRSRPVPAVPSHPPHSWSLTPLRPCLGPSLPSPPLTSCRPTPPSQPEHAPKTLEALGPLGVRFFAPQEIAAVHGFPPDFDFPSSVGKAKRYQLLGNSLSVQVWRVGAAGGGGRCEGDAREMRW